uniref:Uncharacterized protein n=1 Tax=Oryza sativa subsp. japonica TaxID=39947 RepID=Q6H5D3_ORYSJ|nr:hypothetical protein [Oryza sativa Japonica Group]
MGVKLRIWSTQTRDGWIRDLRVQGVQIWITSLGRVFDDTRWCGQRTAYLADGSGAAEARTTGSGAPKLGMAGFATSEFRVDLDDTRWCGRRTAYLADGSGAAEARTVGSGAPILGMAGSATSEFRVFGSGAPEFLVAGTVRGRVGGCRCLSSTEDER